MIPYRVFDQFKLGPVNIQVWGLLVALGFIFGILISIAEAKRKNIDIDHVLNLSILSFFGSFFGARILAVFFDWNFYSENPVEILKIWEGGLSLYGGFFGAIIFGSVYLRVKKLKLWLLADTLVPGLVGGIAIGRIGCFLIHDHLGKIMERPMFFGVNYFGEIRHEPILYEIISMVILFFIIWLVRKRANKDGSLAIFFIYWYSVFRFIFDFFRAEDFLSSDVRLFNFTYAQYFSIIIVIIGLFLLVARVIKKDNQGLINN